MAFKVEVEDGKYTFVNDNGIVKILRYDKEWQDETGNKALLCLLQKVEELQKENERLRTKNNRLIKEYGVEIALD